jgi:hypothetical protein
MAVAKLDPASRTPGFVDVVQRNQFLEFGYTRFLIHLIVFLRVCRGE